MKRILIALAAVAPLSLFAQTVTNSPTSIATGVSGGFDTGAVTGLSILGFLMILGAVVRGVKVYKSR